MDEICCEDMVNLNWNPRVVVIGPGGSKGFKTLGFLSPIEDSGLLRYTDTYCGVSVGAIISLLIVAGYKIREIVGEMANLDIFKDLDNMSISSMLEKRGFISSAPIRERLTQLILNKFGVVPTLRGLYLQTGKCFVSVTLNATDEETEIMGPFTHPNVSCVDATMFSINIPFVFYQLVYHGKTYVDGALGNPYPVDYFDDGNTDILGIFMKSSNKNCNMTGNVNSIIQKLDDISSIPICSYSYKVVFSLMQQKRYDVIRNSSSRCKHICLETNFFDVVGLGLTKEQKTQMLVEGFNDGKKFINQIDTETYVPQAIPTQKIFNYPPYYLMEAGSTDDNNVSILSAMATVENTSN